MQSITVSVIGREGCHLCEEATQVITSVVKDLPTVSLQHHSLEDNPEWVVEYSDKIPVVLVNKELHTYWRVDPERLLETLLAAGAVSGKN